MKKTQCVGNESPIASLMPVSSAAATSAESGGRSRTATGQSESGVAFDVESATTATDRTVGGSRLIDGWVCSDANPFGHTVQRRVREAHQLDGLWPAALVLTFGDGPADESKRIAVPERVLAWLLTGKEGAGD